MSEEDSNKGMGCGIGFLGGAIIGGIIAFLYSGNPIAGIVGAIIGAIVLAIVGVIIEYVIRAIIIIVTFVAMLVWVLIKLILWEIPKMIVLSICYVVRKIVEFIPYVDRSVGHFVCDAVRKIKFFFVTTWFKGIDAFSKKILCPYCLDEINRRVIKNTNKCPHCEKVLPADILEYEKYLRFSVLGITGSGKTNFLTTMLHEFRNAVGNPWVLSPMIELTKLMFLESERVVYDERQPVAATPRGKPIPQLWRIKDKTKKTEQHIPSYSLTIFDGSGEDCEQIDPEISRYIESSKELVILIDPLALPGVAKTIPKDILNCSTTTSHAVSASADMINGLASNIRISCDIASSQLIDRDVAVVFTKIDALMNDFDFSKVMKPSPHLDEGAFVIDDADAVDAEIRDWLSLSEPEFLNAIETNFRGNRVRFFGVSSFGQPPTEENRLGEVLPHRVVDPFIWMLSKEGIVPIKQHK